MLLNKLNFFQFIFCEVEMYDGIKSSGCDWGVSKEDMRTIIKDVIVENQIIGGSPLITNINQIEYAVEDNNSIDVDQNLNAIDMINQADSTKKLSKIIFTKRDLKELSCFEEDARPKIESSSSSESKIKRFFTQISHLNDKRNSYDFEETCEHDVTTDDILLTKYSNTDEILPKYFKSYETEDYRVIEIKPKTQKVTFKIVRDDGFVISGYVNIRGNEITNGKSDKKSILGTKVAEMAFFLRNKILL